MTILLAGILLILYGIFAKKKYSVWVGIFFVLLIMGFQEGVPGDYMVYKKLYNGGMVDAGLSGDIIKDSEFAYIWVTEFLSTFMNFHLFVLLSSLVQCIIMGMMIKNYAGKNYQYFGVLLIFFTFNIMLIQMKAMRQGYAVDMILLAYLLLEKRKYFSSLIPVILAYGFHNSSIIIIPFYLVFWIIMYLRRKEKNDEEYDVVIKKTKGVSTALFVLLGLLVFYFFKYVVFASYINPFLEGIESFSYSGYLDQFEDDRDISWWIMLYHAVSVFAVALYYVNEHNLFKRNLALLVLLALFLSVGTFGFGNLMRTTAFFITFSIVVFPNVATMLRASFGKTVALGYIIFNIAYLMTISVRAMVSMDVSNGTGFGTYTFSFLNW